MHRVLFIETGLNSKYEITHLPASIKARAVSRRKLALRCCVNSWTAPQTVEVSSSWGTGVDITGGEVVRKQNGSNPTSRLVAETELVGCKHY